MGDNDKNARGYMEFNFQSQDDGNDDTLPKFDFIYAKSGGQQYTAELKLKTVADEEKGNIYLVIKGAESEECNILLTAKASSEGSGGVGGTGGIEISKIPTDWDITNVKTKFENEFQGEWLPIHYYKDPQEEFQKNANIRLEEINMLTGSDTEYFKIGLQAQPGMLFTLDGEELRVGPTGIYQIEYNDLKIYNIGIVPPNGTAEDKFFILDYKARPLT